MTFSANLLTYLLKKRIGEGADYDPYRQPVCDYSSSNKQGRNIACCKSYRKLKQHMRNDGLNIPIHFVVVGAHMRDVPLFPVNLRVGTQKQFERAFGQDSWNALGISIG